jgi:hypothetical protein
MGSLHRSDRGFTLPEMLVMIAFFLVISGMGLAVVNGVLPSVRIDGQISRVMGLLQHARELAIARQRDYEVRFDTTAHTVELLRREGAAEFQLQLIAFESRVKFMQFSGMGDTPEGFGDGDLADFGGASRLLFISDGSLVDENSMPVNGTLYLGIEGHRETARAITVTGSTARARFYKWAPQSETWEGGWLAR